MGGGSWQFFPVNANRDSQPAFVIFANLLL